MTLMIFISQQYVRTYFANTKNRVVPSVIPRRKP